MNRSDLVAAALDRWRIETEPGNDMPSMPSVRAAGDDLARLLRESNPPANSDRVTDGIAIAISDRRLCSLSGKPEPAAPALGEDEALLAMADRLSHYMDNPQNTCDAFKALAARLRAALADVARERERADTNLANAKEVQQKWCDESNRAIRLEDELDEARAALAMVEE